MATIWRSELVPLRDAAFSGLDNLNVYITGHRQARLADNIHFLADVDGEALLTLLESEDVIASSGSTCYQYAQKESHVLEALGFEREDVRGSVLLTLGIDQSKDTITRLLEVLGRSLERLRKLKP